MKHEIYKKGSENPLLALEENTDYLVRFAEEISDQQREELLTNYGMILQPLHHNLFLMNFGNFVGETVFCGQTYRVDSKKISTGQMDDMLRFITSRMASLPYQAVSPTKLRVKSDAAWKAILYHLWNDLRQALLVEWEGATLEEWWECVAREPHHCLERETIVKPLWKSHQMDERTISSILKSPELWQPLKRNHALASTRLAQRLNGSLPSELEQIQKRIQYDTPENRMLKWILSEVFEITREIDKRLANRRFFNHLEMKRTNRLMQERLESMMSAPWLAEVGSLQHIPSSSTVLQKKNGYRQWYSFYQRILLGSQYPLPEEDITSLIEGKDIAKLYEYWCFFQVVDAVERLTQSKPYFFAKEPNDDGFTQLKEGLKISFLVKGTERLDVYFNKCFSRNGGSYTQPYRPDISLNWRSEWHHFDAKFKYMSVQEKDQVHRYVKKEDIDKMHTYKDAILGTQTAWVLFPDAGHDFAFYHEGGQKESGDVLCGIGAVGVMPGELAGLERGLRKVLSGCLTDRQVE